VACACFCVGQFLSAAPISISLSHSKLADYIYQTSLLLGRLSSSWCRKCSCDMWPKIELKRFFSFNAHFKAAMCGKAKKFFKCQKTIILPPLFIYFLPSFFLSSFAPTWLGLMAHCRNDNKNELGKANWRGKKLKAASICANKTADN
jgi:hypothetical protein